MGRQISKVLALQAGEHELYPRIHDKKKKKEPVMVEQACNSRERKRWEDL